MKKYVILKIPEEDYKDLIYCAEAKKRRGIDKDLITMVDDAEENGLIEAARHFCSIASIKYTLPEDEE